MITRKKTQLGKYLANNPEQQEKTEEISSSQQLHNSPLIQSNTPTNSESSSSNLRKRTYGQSFFGINQEKNRQNRSVSFSGVEIIDDSNANGLEDESVKSSSDGGKTLGQHRVEVKNIFIPMPLTKEINPKIFPNFLPGTNEFNPSREGIAEVLTEMIKEDKQVGLTDYEALQIITQYRRKGCILIVKVEVDVSWLSKDRECKPQVMMGDSEIIQKLSQSFFTLKKQDATKTVDTKSVLSIGKLNHDSWLHESGRVRMGYYNGISLPENENIFLDKDDWLHRKEFVTRPEKEKSARCIYSAFLGSVSDLDKSLQNTIKSFQAAQLKKRSRPKQDMLPLSRELHEAIYMPKNR